MRQRGKLSVGKAAVSLALAALLTVLSVAPISAAGGSDPSRAIAIVFDNSGSMYTGANATAWCRATYAIEVFASMMNDGDTLSVYPMYEVQADGRMYDDSNPVKITNRSSSSIRSMYTPKAEDTPIETIDRAFAGVNAAEADEKWLIVLTDGAEFYENGKGLGEGEPTRAALTERLTKYNNSVNVMYLGMGAAATEPDIAGRMKHYTAAAKDTVNVLTELTTMCNNIFGRDALKVNGQNISFDIPLSKLIVFVQGDNISNVKVADAAGNSVGEVFSSYNPRYGEKGAGNYSVNVDRSLQGAIITYANCEKGDYSISYDGSMSSISVYYEPDVDMSVTLRNPEGDEISPEAAYEGAYTVAYQMVDKYGQPTESKLLGHTEFTFTYNISGTEYTHTADHAGEFLLEQELAEGDTLQVSADVKYLSGYQIHKNHEDLLPGFSNPITVIADNNRFKLKLSAEQNYFQIAKLDSAQPLTAKATIEGHPLSDGEMQKAGINVVIEDKNGNALPATSYAVEKIPEESLWTITLKDKTALTPGKYTVRATATAWNHSNEEVSASDTEHIKISTIPRWLIPAVVGLAILLLLLLLWLFMNAKVLPKAVTFVNTKFAVDGEPISGSATVRFSGGGKKRGTVTITSPRVSGASAAKCSLKMDVEAVSPRRVRSAKRAMCVKNVVASPGNGNIQTIMAGSSQFKWSPAEKKYVKLGGKPNAPVSFNVGNMARYGVSGQTTNGVSISLTGQLKHQ